MVVYIILTALIILMFILLVFLMILLRRNKNGKYNNVIYSGGYNTDTGFKEDASSKLFDGMEVVKGDTYCIDLNTMEGAGRQLRLYNCTTGECYIREIKAELIIGRMNSMAESYSYLYIGGDDNISRNHCKITNETGQLYIQDMNSSNHTYLNGKIVAGSVKLNNDDLIKIGKTKLKIML